jgi:hypothetical protein
VYGLTFTKGKIENLFYRFFINLRFMIRLVVSVCKIVAVGQADAEETALQWASEHGIVTCRNTSTAFTWPQRLTGREVSRRTAWLLENVLQSEGTLLLTVNFPLGPEHKRAIEFLGPNPKPFLHIWSAVPQAGLLARRFLESHAVKILNVVGSSRDTGKSIEVFARSVFEALLISSNHV